MNGRKRLSGGERGEERRERQRMRWLRDNLSQVSAGALTVVLVGVALGLAVLGGGGHGDEASVTLPSPTPQVGATIEVDDSGPPAVDAEPTFTDSGLGIIDIESGTGETPETGQTLVVDYTGWLSEDGRKFESSLDRGEPIYFRLGAGRVIAGLDEGLATMKVGGKRRLIIPADLAFGEQGRPPTIPANAELIFDVELLEIKEAP
jgi:peptidylprolyl isomerase